MRFGIADLLIVHLVERLEAVERFAANVGRHAGRIVDVQDRIARRAERHAGMFAGQIAARPQPGRNGLDLLGVGRLGDQHDERRQVLVERAQPVRHPGAEARPAGDLVAGLHEGDGRLVVDGLGVHRADEAHVVDHLGRVQGSSSVTHMPLLPCWANLILRRRDREPRLAAGHGGQPLALRIESGRSLSYHRSSSACNRTGPSAAGRRPCADRSRAWPWGENEALRWALAGRRTVGASAARSATRRSPAPPSRHAWRHG